MSSDKNDWRSRVKSMMTDPNYAEKMASVVDDTRKVNTDLLNMSEELESSLSLDKPTSQPLDLARIGEMKAEDAARATMPSEDDNYSGVSDLATKVYAEERKKRIGKALQRSNTYFGAPHGMRLSQAAADIYDVEKAKNVQGIYDKVLQDESVAQAIHTNANKALLKAMEANQSLSEEEQKKIYDESVSKQLEAIGKGIDKYLYDINAPKSEAEWVAKNAVNSSIVGQMLTSPMNVEGGENAYRQQALADYGAKASWLSQGVSMAGSLIIDTLPMMGIGTAFAAPASKAAMWGVGKVGGKALQGSLIGRGVVGSVGGAATLGGYNAASTLTAQFSNGQFDLGEITSSAGHGALMGGLTGIMSPMLRGVSQGMGKVGKAATMAGGLGAEAGIFSAAELAEMENPYDFETIAQTFGKNVVVIGGLKLSNPIKTIGEYKRWYNEGKQSNFDDADYKMMADFAKAKGFANNEAFSMSADGVYSRSIADRVTGNRTLLEMTKLEGGKERNLAIEMYNDPNVPISLKTKIAAKMNLPAPKPLLANGVRVEGNKAITYCTMPSGAQQVIEIKEFARPRNARAFANEFSRTTARKNDLMQTEAAVNSISTEPIVIARLNEQAKHNGTTYEDELARLNDIVQRAAEGTITPEDVAYYSSIVDTDISATEAIKQGIKDEYGVEIDDILKSDGNLTDVQDKALTAYADALRGIVEQGNPTTERMLVASTSGVADYVALNRLGIEQTRQIMENPAQRAEIDAQMRSKYGAWLKYFDGKMGEDALAAKLGYDLNNSTDLQNFLAEQTYFKNKAADRIAANTTDVAKQLLEQGGRGVRFTEGGKVKLQGVPYPIGVSQDIVDRYDAAMQGSGEPMSRIVNDALKDIIKQSETPSAAKEPIIEETDAIEQPMTDTDAVTQQMVDARMAEIDTDLQGIEADGVQRMTINGRPVAIIKGRIVADADGKVDKTKSSTEVAYMLLDENGRPILEDGKPKIEVGVKPSNVRVEDIEQWRSVDDYKAAEEQRIRENNRLTDEAMQMADEQMPAEEVPAESKAEEITDPQTTDELLTLCKGDRELALDVAMDELNRAQQSKGKGANAAETMAINQRIRTYQRMVDDLSKAEETPTEIPTEQTTDTQVTDDMEFIYQKDLGENHDGMEPMQLADGRYKWVGLQRGELTATMGERDAELLDRLAKKLGVAVIPIDVADSAVNGYYRDGNIYVNTNRGAEWTMRWVAGHEMLHDVAKKSPDAYNAYKQAVLDMWGEDYVENQVKQIIEDYKASGKQIDREQALTELVNDFGGELFNSRDGLGILDNILKTESKRGNVGFVDTIKQWWEKLKEWFSGTPYYKNVEKLLKDAYSEAIANAEEFRRNQEMDKGVSSVTDAARVEGAAIDFSIKTEPQVAQRLREYAESKDGKKHGWDKKKIESIINETEDLIDAIHNSLQGNQRYDAWADKNPTMRVDWRDGELKQTVTWSRGNVEYKYDMSADLLCINNEALEDVLASPAMVQIVRGMDTLSKNGFTSDDYLRIYQVLRDKGFVVPCAGCFDAAARFKMLPSVAKNFAELVNKTIDERNADPEAFDAKVKAMANGKTTIEGLPTSANTKEDAIMIGVAGDKLTEHITSEQLLSAQGQTDMLATLGGIFRAWQRTGAGRPKDKLLPEPYVGDINSTSTTILGKYGEKTPSYRDIYVNQGTGLRRNSHSEFRPLLAIDEIQFMRDAFAKGLTVFKYMKELDDVRLFGNMGVKFNMSFFPAFAKDDVAAGLDANGNYIASEESVGSREFAYMGEDGRTHFDGMRGWQEAQKYTNENVSLSSVVFSVPHLIKSLTDVPTPSDKSGIWGSLIPFHSSGATSAHLALQGLGRARANGVGHPFSEALSDYNKGVTNFEAVQNDRFGEGWVIVEGKKAGTAIESGHKLEFVNGTHMYNERLGVHLFKDGYIFDKDIKKKDNYGNGKVNTKNVKKYMTKFYVDYNDKVRELGGDYAYKDAADYYLRELPKIGLIPRFSFEVPESTYLEMCKAANVDPKHPKLGWKGEGNAWNPIDAESYYSLFCDYGMTDPKTGKWSPHKPIGNVDENGNRVFRLPDNAVQIVKDAVDKYSARRDKEESRINGVYEEFLKRSVNDGRLSEAEAQNLLSEISTDPNGGGGKPIDAEFSIKADKQKQLDIINRTNPAHDDYHTWIRTTDDIKTLQEAVDEIKAEDADYNLSTYPDVTDDMINEALQSGKITIYSSKPIKEGVFVSPSQMQAKDYAGGGRIYSKQVPINDVAWINTDEGMFAPVEYSVKGKRADESVLDYAKRMRKEGADAEYSIAQTKSKEFKDWFGDWEKDPDEASKVVDENGKPKVVLHGTPNTNFYEFKEEKIGSSNDPGWLGSGFYFYGNNPKYASQYANGGRVMEVYLNIRNPYYATAEDIERLAEANSAEASREFREELEAEGYDGVYYNGDFNEEWVAFYPNQIKSATDNIGTFDGKLPDIRYSIKIGGKEYENDGYTQREDGTNLSVRALDAEEDGSFSRGNFVKAYKVAKKDFDLLQSLGVIKNTEWHHTGNNFRETDFFTWADSTRNGGNASYSDLTELEPESIGAKYKANKKEIGALIGEYEKQEWGSLPKYKKQMPTLENFTGDYIKKHAVKELSSNWLTIEDINQKNIEQNEISKNRELYSPYERFQQHKLVDAKYEDRAEVRKKEWIEAHKEEIQKQYDVLKAETDKYNSNIASHAEVYANDAKGKYLMQILDLLGYSAEDAAKMVNKVHYGYNYLQRTNRAEQAREAVNREYAQKEAEMRQDFDKWFNKSIKDGKITFVERLPNKPEFFITKKEEMNGRYGWFEASSRYNLPVYYSGYQFGSKRLYDSYIKRQSDIVKVRDEGMVKASNAYNEEIFDTDPNDAEFSIKGGKSGLKGANSDAYKRIIELAGAYNKEAAENEGNPEWKDNYFDYEKQVKPLAKTLTDEALDELYNELEERFDSGIMIADIMEGREAMSMHKRVDEQNKSNEKAVSKVKVELDALKEAVKSGNKSAIKKSKEALTEAVIKHGLGHKYMREQIYLLKQAKRTDANYARNKAAADALENAAAIIEAELNNTVKKAGLEGVSLSFNGHGFWLSAEQGSKFREAVEKLDNNERWFDEVNESTGGLPDDLPQLTMNNIDEYVARVKDVLGVTIENPKDSLERVDKVSKEEKTENYKQEQIEQERAEYEAKEQWRKDNAAAITSSFFAERRLDKADKIQKLKDEINKLIKETRATNKENSEKVKEIAKEMQAYIKENIPTETQGDMTRTQFEQVIKQLSTAITRKDLEKPMRMVEYIGANTNRRALTRQMRDFIKQGFKGMTPKGLVKAKNVDGATSRVLGLAKSLYESMGKQPLGSDLRALQTKVRGIKAELEDLNNANGGAFSEYVEQINAILKKSGVDRYEEMTKYYNELSDRQDVGEIQVGEVLDHINRMLPELFSIELVKEQRTQAKADSAMTTKEDLEQLKNNLEDKREKGILSEEDQAVLDNMAMYELMVGLQQRQLDIDGPGTSSIASQMAAKVREAKQYRDELDKYDDKQSGIAKNLKDSIKRVNAEMEELFVQRTQAQKEVNANVAELLDNLKQLRDTGNSALKEWSKNKQERETRIVTMANASFGKDARGYWSEVDRRGGWKRDFSNKINNLRLAALMSPALSFEYMVGVMDPRYYTNESPIYKQFIKGEDGLIKANDNFFEGLESFNNGINEAVERFINRNAMQSLKEYFNRGDRFATEIIPFEFEVKENVNGEVVTSIVHRDAEMTRGRAAKIYAWSRMADGMAKLKAHGVTDETLEVVKAFIGQDYMDFIDWVEDEYFPKLRREKYNPIYKQMYGISMAENEHYFPFETYKKDIRTEKELEQINSDNLGGGIVGNIIERKRNNARLDFTDESPDIFDAISEYGRKMEEWAAYAQVREDLKKVINDKQFKQHCDELGTHYYKYFLEAAQVASRLSRDMAMTQHTQSGWAKAQKTIASAAISLRVSTALKQLLSAPAFMVYSLDPAFHHELIKTVQPIDVESAVKGLWKLAEGDVGEAKKLLLSENWVGHYNWCVENLPSFRERVTLGGAGNPILEEKGFAKFADGVQSVGMLPNRLVDAFTCSVGAKAIYEYAFKKYKKNYSEKTAHNMAVTDAEIAFNSSQQSSNPVFLAPMQVSKQFLLRGMMNYKNSPIGYYRNAMKASIDMYRATKAIFGQPKFTINGEVYGFESGGKNPYAMAAESGARASMFWLFLNLIWNFGTVGVAGLSHTMLNGSKNDDGNALYTDEEIKKALGDDMRVAVFNAATQGIPWVSGFASAAQTGQDYTPSILFSEMNNYVEQINKDGFMSMATAQIFTDLLLKNAAGVDPEVWGQIYRGAQGIMEDRPMRIEDFMNLIASPRSAISGVAKQKVGEYNNMQDYVNARIESEREIGINETMDLGKKLTGLRPLRKSKLDGYIDEYLADKIPDYRELANKPDEKAKEERMEESNAFKNLNTLVSTVQHTEEKKKSSKKIDGNEETKDKVKKIRKAVNVIHKLYASGDASSAQRIADELERRLKRGYNANGATLDDKLKNVDIYDSTGTTEQRGTDGFDTMFDRAMLGGFDGVYLGSKLD